MNYTDDWLENLVVSVEVIENINPDSVENTKSMELSLPNVRYVKRNLFSDVEEQAENRINIISNEVLHQKDEDYYHTNKEVTKALCFICVQSITSTY